MPLQNVNNRKLSESKLSMIVVLDACAIIAYLRGETGSNVVETLLEDEDVLCLAHSVQLCEVYYDFLRVTDEETADEAIADLQTAGVTFHEDMDIPFWQQVGKYKAKHRVSLADCFALALTARMNGELVTSDHHEFDSLDAQGICTFKFIR
jgi:PIN domain nuclease of toxin-antitoxin system